MKTIIFWLGVAIIFACVAMSCTPMTKLDKILQVHDQMYYNYKHSYDATSLGWRIKLDNYDCVYVLYRDGEQAIMTHDRKLYRLYEDFMEELHIPIQKRQFYDQITGRLVRVMTYRRKIFIPVLPHELRIKT